VLRGIFSLEKLFDILIPRHGRRSLSCSESHGNRVIHVDLARITLRRWSSLTGVLLTTLFASECLADRALWEDARRPHHLKTSVDPRIPGCPFVCSGGPCRRGQEMEGSWAGLESSGSLNIDTGVFMTGRPSSERPNSPALHKGTSRSLQLRDDPWSSSGSPSS
jgi:hypothetical protein